MNKNEAEKRQLTAGERFEGLVLRQAQAEIGVAEFTPQVKRLIQHMFIHINNVMKELEIKRLDNAWLSKNRPPIEWKNINHTKLAFDALHRATLGLDAMIPNHISPIPYYNKRSKLYDLDLRIGYRGKDYYRRQFALDPPVLITYELVYSTDKFQAIKSPNGESYSFEITNPFQRGEIIGGFGYMIYDNPIKNKLVLVSEEDFKKAESYSKSGKSSKKQPQDDEEEQLSGNFWKNHPDKMRYKTLVLRVTDHLIINPAQVNESFNVVEVQDSEEYRNIEHDLPRLEANQGAILDTDDNVSDANYTDVPAEPQDAPEADENGEVIPPEESPKSKSKPQSKASKETKVGEQVSGFDD